MTPLRMPRERNKKASMTEVLHGTAGDTPEGTVAVHKPMLEQVHPQKDCGLCITHNGTVEIS